MFGVGRPISEKVMAAMEIKASRWCWWMQWMNFDEQLTGPLASSIEVTHCLVARRWD